MSSKRTNKYVTCFIVVLTLLPHWINGFVPKDYRGIVPKNIARVCDREISSWKFRYLQNSRKPRDDYYDDYDDYYDEDWNGDDKYYNTKYSGQSEQEKELKQMASGETNYYGLSKMDRNRNDDLRESSIRRKKVRYVDDWEEEYDEVGGYRDIKNGNDNDEASSIPGNYWSNPKNEMDPLPRSSELRTRRPRRPPPDEIYYRSGNRRSSSSGNSRARRRSKRTSFSNERPPPPAVADFYDQIFWHGFDPGYSDGGVGDKTAFGGTKGKFNGLNFLFDGLEKQGNQESLKPRRKSRKSYYDDEDGYIDKYDNGVEEHSDSLSRSRSPSVKPPNDAPYPRRESGDSPRTQRPRTPRTRPRRNDYDYDDEYDSYDSRNGNDDDWVSKQVASWFTANENSNDDYDGGYEDRTSRRRGRKEDNGMWSNWSPFNAFNAFDALDMFFGVDSADREDQADKYNRQMGIESRGRSNRRVNRRRSYPVEPQRRRKNTSTPRRPGYAYRFDREEEMPPEVVDYEVKAEPIETEPIEADFISTPTSNRDDTANDNFSTDKDIVQARPVRTPRQRAQERTWEERAQAVERIPPANISAWGPSGELGMDARSKAIIDALEDIQTAKRKVELKERKERFAQEDITILKVDAELQRKRMLRNDERYREAAEERLREIEFDIDDASRVLRRARSQVQLAREKLEELEDRHWALLSMYNADQAGERISEAFRELEEQVPATRLDSIGESTSSSDRPSFPKIDSSQEQGNERIVDIETSMGDSPPKSS